ncbi:F0F1 ATP synthase subunit delta [Clostridium fermenticellae]|uniref:ATP synthase subunit delta n=1 Tax=Clostridium fermenticellae TaxID=2068654 RepID=A0A386H0K0_9CLOT|nr:F0F1 ATP synthase subunit delta [Clostridium fermenticellae]AYD39201.1 F0F1 ATP synthase subunit delta [Clostridium fermenticellae]
MHEYLDRRYALALYKVAEEKGQVNEYLQELEDVVAAIHANEDFSKLMKHPQVSTSNKKKLFEAAFKGKVSNDVLSFLLLLIEKGRISELDGKLLEFKKINLERNNTVVAKVKTVVPLLEDERNLLKDKLQRKYSKKIILREEIDEGIIGGVYVQVDNEVIDGTVKSKIQEMKKLMLK